MDIGCKCRHNNNNKKSTPVKQLSQYIQTLDPSKGLLIAVWFLPVVSFENLLSPGKKNELTAHFFHSIPTTKNKTREMWVQTQFVLHTKEISLPLSFPKHLFVLLPPLAKCFSFRSVRIKQDKFLNYRTTATPVPSYSLTDIFHSLAVPYFIDIETVQSFLFMKQTRASSTND